MERRQLDNMRQSLLDEGFIGEAFIQLERLQTDADPNFLEEVISTFYRFDSARCLQDIEQAWEKTPVDFIELDNLMTRLRAYCSVFGSKRITNKCTEFMAYCRTVYGNPAGCKMTLQQLKEELATLKEKLEAYFLLGRQVRAAEAAGGSNQSVENGVLL